MPSKNSYLVHRWLEPSHLLVTSGFQLLQDSNISPLSILACLGSLRVREIPVLGLHNYLSTDIPLGLFLSLDMFVYIRCWKIKTHRRSRTRLRSQLAPGNTETGNYSKILVLLNSTSIFSCCPCLRGTVGNTLIHTSSSVRKYLNNKTILFFTRHVSFQVENCMLHRYQVSLLTASSRWHLYL